MEKVDAPKCASYNGVYRMVCATELYQGSSANMWKDIAFSKLYQAQLSIVGMCRVILEAMKASSKKTKRFIQVSSVSGSGKLATELDTSPEDIPDKAG
jgi:hypothetical protein